jgi:hypothetical protein
MLRIGCKGTRVADQMLSVRKMGLSGAAKALDSLPEAFLERNLGPCSWPSRDGYRTLQDFR